MEVTGGKKKRTVRGMSLGQAIRAARGQTLQDDLEAEGFDQSTVSRWENDHSTKRIDLERIAAFERVCNRPLGYVLALAGFATVEGVELAESDRSTVEALPEIIKLGERRRKRDLAALDLRAEIEDESLHDLSRRPDLVGNRTTITLVSGPRKKSATKAPLPKKLAAKGKRLEKPPPETHRPNPR